MSASKSLPEPGPRFVAVAVLADVPPGQVTSAEVDGHRVALVNDGGQIHAIDHDCSHAGGPLGQGRTAGCLVACPWHGAVFDVRTGEPARGPARKPLRTHRVALDGDTILVAVDEQRAPTTRSDAQSRTAPIHQETLTDAPRCQHREDLS